MSHAGLALRVGSLSAATVTRAQDAIDPRRAIRDLQRLGNATSMVHVEGGRRHWTKVQSDRAARACHEGSYIAPELGGKVPFKRLALPICHREAVWTCRRRRTREL